MKNIEYKGHTIEITHDDYPTNPFKEWDCEPPVMYRNGEGTTDFSHGAIERFMYDFLTDNQLIYHQESIFDILNETGFDGDESREEKIDYLREAISEANLSEKAKILEKFKVPHCFGCSRGYSQSDWADVLIIPTPDYIEATGVNKNNLWEIAESTFKLFGYWAWGDVYSYYIPETGDSCSGFFGDNHEESGLMENAKNSIDYQVKQNLKNRIKKIKTLIRNAVPIQIRAQALN